MDLNSTAFRIVEALTNENKEDARVSAARIGGKHGGPARAAVLSPERRKEIAVKANRARWDRAKEPATVNGKQTGHDPTHS
jgi:hypothetical protein